MYCLLLTKPLVMGYVSEAYCFESGQAAMGGNCPSVIRYSQISAKGYTKNSSVQDSRIASSSSTSFRKELQRDSKSGAAGP